MPMPWKIYQHLSKGPLNRRTVLPTGVLTRPKRPGSWRCWQTTSGGHETRIAQLAADEAALKAEGEQLDQAWHALWSEMPIEVLAPDVMLAWLEAREDVVTLIGRKRDVQCQLGDSRREEQEAIAQVHATLNRVGWDAVETEANELRVMVERADTYRREQEDEGREVY